MMKKWILSVKAMVICLAVMLSASCGKTPHGLPEINGVKGPQFSMIDGKVLLTLKLLTLNVDAGFKAPIPKTENSFFEFSPNIIDGGMMLVFHIDIEDLKQINVGLGDGNYLPDGRPVPGIPGGRLENSIRIDTPLKDISFFYHKSLFGVWIPFGFDTAGLSGYWNVYYSGRNVGFLGLVGSEEAHGYKAGGLIFLRLENLKDPQFKRMIQISKRNPHIVY